jgi:hypothetical protein
MNIGRFFRTAICGTALSVGATLSASPLSANTVQNPGFELGNTLIWSQGAGWEATTFSLTGPNSGNYFAVNFGASRIGQTVPTVAGTVYDFSFAYFLASNNSAVEVDWNGGIVTTLIGGVNSGAWITHHFKVLASGPTTEFFFQWVGGINDGLDDVSVEAATTPLPAALPLFAAGLGALGLVGWRRKWKCKPLD